MSPRAIRATGIVLLVAAIAWTAGAFWTIPAGFGAAPISPRSFPIALGVILVLLSLGLIAGTFLKETGESAPAADAGDRRSEIWAFAASFGFLIVYTALLDRLGFLIATLIASAAMLLFVFRIRSPLLLIGMPLGLAFGIWFVMGKLMGVYLPHGAF